MHLLEIYKFNKNNRAISNIIIKLSKLTRKRGSLDSDDVSWLELERTVTYIPTADPNNVITAVSPLLFASSGVEAWLFGKNSDTDHP